MPGNQLATWETWFAGTAWVPWLILGLAVFLRFFLLDIKPAHFDEGINGWFVDQMMKNGFYRYDPTNYHGPLHFYVLLLSESLFGRNIWALRLPVVLVSIGCVWLCLKFEPLVGRNVSRIAALAMAVSPGFVFYGRYSIHEVWLVLFSMMFILGLLGLWKFGTTNYLWWAGIGVAGMILTKETYIIHLVCAAVAIPVLMVSHTLNRLPDARPAWQTWTYLDLVMVVGVGVGAIVFFYSGTFLNWGGVKGLYQTFHAWSETGRTGHGHEKPWYYWLDLIRRYEIPVGVGLILCVFCQELKNVSLRYLAIYGVGTLIAYSYVKYKTPWCIISFVWPFLFIFGAAILLVRPKYLRATYVGIGLLLSISLGSTIWLNYFRCTTDTEPYVYVQTY
ncbi:MAG: flippase activity-associated protein Agl23, partial [Pyrinomonadaceae bacterium]